MAGGINPKVTGHHRRPVQHLRHGEAFGHEPVLQMRGDLIVGFRLRQHRKQGRGDPLPLHLGQPILWKSVEIRGGEGQAPA